MAKSDRLLDVIPALNLFKAVNYARDLIRKGTNPGLANMRAAKYYKVDISDVAHRVGKLASRVKCARK